MRKFRVVVNGTTYEVDIEEIGDSSLAPPPSPAAAPAPQPAEAASAQKPRPPQSPKPVIDDAGGAVFAQMPGTIIEVKVSQGEPVKKGQPLVILEAMKMANEVVAPRDGSVSEVHVEKGASVNAGDILAVLS